MVGGDTARVVGEDVVRATDGGDTALVVVGGDRGRGIGRGTDPATDVGGFETVRVTFLESEEEMRLNITLVIAIN